MISRFFTRRRKPDEKALRIPTVRFDASLVTESVKADLWKTIQEFEDLPAGEERAIYEAALLSISRGRDLYVLSVALVDMGVAKERAADIALMLNNRASSIMEADRKVALGITHAQWTYAGAPCFSGRSPAAADRRRDAAHKAANGKLYPLATGMLIDGRHIHPGREPGCKCVSIVVVPGFD
jgi:hypothetical protein